MAVSVSARPAVQMRFPAASRETPEISVAAQQGGNTGAGNFDLAQRAHQIGKGIDLLGASGDLEDKALKRRIHNIGPKDVCQPKRFHALATEERVGLPPGHPWHRSLPSWT